MPDRVASRTPVRRRQPVDALLARATAGRAELRALNAAVRRFSLEADVARASDRTGADDSAQASSAPKTRARHGRAPVFGVSVAVPLFNRGAPRGRSMERRAHARGVRTDRPWRPTIRGQITRAVEAFTLRRQSTPVVVAAVSSADELITIADVAYREGEIGILQLVDAYRTAARARERADRGQSESYALRDRARARRRSVTVAMKYVSLMVLVCSVAPVAGAMRLRRRRLRMKDQIRSA